MNRGLIPDYITGLPIEIFALAITAAPANATTAKTDNMTRFITIPPFVCHVLGGWFIYYYQVRLTRDRQRISPDNAQGEQELGKAQKRGYRNDRLRATGCKGIDRDTVGRSNHVVRVKN
jgi:hypothetical protein